MGTVEQHLLSAEQRWQAGSAAQGKALEDVNRRLPRCALLGHRPGGRDGIPVCHE